MSKISFEIHVFLLLLSSILFICKFLWLSNMLNNIIFILRYRINLQKYRKLMKLYVPKKLEKFTFAMECNCLSMCVYLVADARNY